MERSFGGGELKLNSKVIKKWSHKTGLWGNIVNSSQSMPNASTRSKVWSQQCIGLCTFWVKPIESRIVLKATLSLSHSMSTLMLKSPTIITLSVFNTKSDKKSDSWSKNWWTIQNNKQKRFNCFAVWMRETEG